MVRENDKMLQLLLAFEKKPRPTLKWRDEVKGKNRKGGRVELSQKQE